MATAIATNTFLPPPVAQPIEDRQVLKLLIIGNERIVREACKEAACTLGYAAHATDSIEQAFWFVDSRGPDIILVDWNLPNRAATEVLQKLKSRGSECEVVVLINDGEIESAVEAMKYGASDCLAKPFGLKQLKFVLENVSERLRQRTERKSFAKENQSGIGFGGGLRLTGPHVDRE